ncbi:MAG: GNAT family N-acetyltransferase [Phycisphaerales bacterium]|nr:GNAT family N-acetyltransferase [Planctomycetota bacterium]MCH8507446.1 GNAT family N-acetyltransferase [Phycisphaerales bacterium]
MTEPWGAPRDERDRDFVARALQTSFGMEREPALRAIEQAGELQRVFRDERGEPAGSALVVWCGQFFGGRSVPMAGVRAVAVPPERRGTGVATDLMKALLGEAHERGTPISTLYAATQPLYRRTGYEQAGHRHRVTLDPARLKGRAVPGTRIRPADFDRDHDAIVACHHAMARAMPGNLDRDAYLWSLLRAPRATQTDTLLIEDDAGRIGGVLTSRLERIPYPGRGFALWASDISASSEQGARGVLAAMAGFGSVATEIRLHCGPTHPLLLLLDEQKYRIDHEEHWMTRIVRLADAVGARGYPATLRTRVGVRVHDPLFSDNDGDWTIEVEDGHAEGTRGGDARVELDIGAMAAVYTGFASPEQLALIGRIRGDQEALSTLGAIFAGPTPSMVDFF